MTSIELQSELEKLEVRRGELVRDRAAAQDNLDAAREDLVQGTDRSSEAVVAAQSKLTALAEAVVALVQRIAAKSARLAAARAAEQREIELSRFVEVAGRGESALQRYLEAREEANGEIGRIAERLQASFDELLAVRGDWFALAKVESSGTVWLGEVFESISAAGIDATAVRARWDPFSPLESDKAYQLPGVSPFGSLLSMILGLRDQAVKKEARAAEKAA